MRLRKSGQDKKNTGLTYHEAVEAQRRLAVYLSATMPRTRVGTIAGADVAFAGGGTVAVAGFVLMTWPRLETVDVSVAAKPVEFPYIPGLLSFREIPVLIDALWRLSARPDVIFCDGQGRAHPRRFGLACHLGVVTGTPTIGCAKSVLVGRFEEPPRERGSCSDMIHEDEVVGRAVRTRRGVRPVYVSAGHMMDLETAVEMVLGACGGYRIPEPTRRAHTLVAEAKAYVEKAAGR